MSEKPDDRGFTEAWPAILRQLGLNPDHFGSYRTTAHIGYAAGYERGQLDQTLADEHLWESAEAEQLALTEQRDRLAAMLRQVCEQASNIEYFAPEDDADAVDNAIRDAQALLAELGLDPTPQPSALTA